MADISQYLADILEAVYGEEVRGSIHDAIDIINQASEVVLSTGTAITGPTSSSAGYFLNSLYLNTSTMEIWKCIGTDTWQSQGVTKGADGNGIDNISYTSSEGLVDTYTITFDDGTTKTFTVTNGADGADGTDGTVWYKGTALTGTGTSITGFPAKLNDYYLNSTTGGVYVCVKSGGALPPDAAEWDYVMTLTGGGGGSTVLVIDNLQSTSSSDALSANQGRVLNGKITEAQESIAPVEQNPATANHAQGTQLIYNGTLYDVILPIATGNALQFGVNIQEADPLTEQMADIKASAESGAEAIKEMIAPVETNPATASHAVGSQLIYNEVLYDVILAISPTDSLVVGTNIAVADSVTEQIKDLEADVSGLDADKAEKSDLTSIFATGTTNATGSTISSGTYFYLNGVLVRAKADIASGATFTLNTNYEEVTTGALNERNIVYSTSEKVVGYWHDGRKIYEKSMSGTVTTYSDSGTRRSFWFSPLTPGTYKPLKMWGYRWGNGTVFPTIVTVESAFISSGNMTAGGMFTESSVTFIEVTSHNNTEMNYDIVIQYLKN